jgi:membrane fusion protein (multidrug efflux system)
MPSSECATFALIMLGLGLGVVMPAQSQPGRSASVPGLSGVIQPGTVQPGTRAAQPDGVTQESPRVLRVPHRETTVAAQTVGQVSQLGGELGSPVVQNAPLVVFDCDELKAKMRMSQAELRSAQQQLEAKQSLQKLDAAGDVEVKLARAVVDKADAQLQLSRAQQRQCVLSAPFAGRIVKLHVKQYQSVNVGQPLVDLVSGGPLKIKLNAPSRWLAWLKPGYRFEVRVDETDKVYPATVSAINGRVDAVSQSVEIEGHIGGTFPELLAGMSGTARFISPR